MKVLISNPPWFVPAGAAKIKASKMGIRAGGRWPYTRRIHKNYFPFPFNMAYADAYLKQNGVDSTLRDSILRLDEYVDFFKLASNFDYVVLETATASQANDEYVAREVAKHSKVILVGPYATHMASEIIKRPEVYAMLRGEYEKSLYNCVISGRGGVYDFDEWENIDDAPFPTRDETIYSYKMARHLYALNVWGSRGCPYKCTFCYAGQFQRNNQYRGHSPERLRVEIADALKRFPKIKYIYFDDDTFNIGNERVRGIAKVMKGFDLPWSAMCRVDSCSWETFQAMKDGGCVEVKVGIESGSQRVLDMIHKDLDLEYTKRTIKELKKIGIRVHGTFMYGFPGETKEEMNMTKKLRDELNCNSSQYSQYRVLK